MFELGLVLDEACWDEMGIAAEMFHKDKLEPRNIKILTAMRRYEFHFLLKVFDSLTWHGFWAESMIA